MLTKAYGESAMSKTRVYEGYKSVFKMAVKTLKMTNASDAPAHQQLMKTWKKWKKLLWTIAESQSNKSLMMLAYRLAHAMKFFRMFWVWNAWQQKFVPKLLNFEQKERRMEVAQESLTMPEPPYSPDLAPCHFFLFPKIKRTLKGRHFTAIDDNKSAPMKELKAIPMIEFEKCFKDWKKRWRKCIISNGDYFEGDNINGDE